jgi:glycosyltransferase involved in cell wall biosynthesis
MAPVVSGRVVSAASESGDAVKTPVTDVLPAAPGSLSPVANAPGSLQRIVYLIESLGTGGAEQALVRLATSLDRSQWRPEIWTLRPGPNDFSSELDAASIPVHDLSSLGWNPYTRLGKKALLVATYRLWRSRPTVVHSFLMASYGAEPLAVWMTRVPVYIVRRCNEELFGVLRTWQLKYEVAKRIVVLTQHMRQQLLRQYPHLEKKVQVIPNGVDTLRFAPASTKPGDLRKELGINPRAVVFVCLARLCPEKNHALLVSAFARMAKEVSASCHLVLAGQGPEESPLKQLTAESGLSEKVHFLGLRRDVASILADCDVFVLASRPGTEGMSNAVLEAMSAGLPPVITRCGFEEILEDGREGILVADNDVEKMSQALAFLATNPEARAAMGRRARQKIIQSYSLEKMIAANQAMYCQLLPPFNRSPRASATAGANP